MTEQLRYPGPGGIKVAAIARPPDAAPGVVVIGAAWHGSTWCDALAEHGFVGAAPAADDDDDPNALAGLIGFVAAGHATVGESVTLLGVGEGGSLATVIAREIPELAPRAVTVGLPTGEGAAASLDPTALLTGDAEAWKVLTEALTG